MRGIKKPETEQELREWERGWAEMMITIWRENIIRLGILDTYRLHDRQSHRIVDASGQITIAHQFMEYGIYVAGGVGKYYKKGNSGKDDEQGLRFLGKDYRKKHKMGKAREKRDWFGKRYRRDTYVLSCVERDFYGNAYLGTFSNVISAMFGNKSVSNSNDTGVMASIARF